MAPWKAGSGVGVGGDLPVHSVLVLHPYCLPGSHRQELLTEPLMELSTCVVTEECRGWDVGRGGEGDRAVSNYDDHDRRHRVFHDEMVREKVLVMNVYHPMVENWEDVVIHVDCSAVGREDVL